MTESRLIRLVIRLIVGNGMTNIKPNIRFSRRHKGWVCWHRSFPFRDFVGRTPYLAYCGWLECMGRLR